MSTKDYLEKDYYKALGVPKDASAEDVKRAYRKLAREHHPDAGAGGDPSAARFKEVSEAYSVLSDPKRRAEYDEARSLLGGMGARFGRPGPRGAPRPGTGAGGFPFDLGDLFGGAGTTTGPAGTTTGTPTGGAGGFGDVFSGIFGGRGGRTATGPPRGADLESEVTVGFLEALEGATVQLRMTSEAVCPDCSGTGSRGGAVPHSCPDCEGTGQVSRRAGARAYVDTCPRCRGRGLVVEDPCPRCSGSGRTSTARTMSVRIPAGVQHGQRIRLKGKGGAGERGAPAGDLFVTVSVRPHPVFGRKGDDVTITLPVTITEAALGAQVGVPTPGGQPVTLRLPAGTASGRVLRVRGRGATRKDGTRGDLLVTVEVHVPQRLDDAARSALEALQRATAAEDPRAGLHELARSQR